jgi:hypothetical protein
VSHRQAGVVRYVAYVGAAPTLLDDPLDRLLELRLLNLYLLHIKSPLTYLGRLGAA